MTDVEKPTYTKFELKHELTNVFKSVYFMDKLQKKKLSQSYFLNFDILLEYARENHIDEMEYIRSIRSILLTCPNTYAI